MGEIYAILTAVLRGYSVIPVRKGLKHSTPSTSAIMYLLINTTMLWAITLYNHSLELLLADGFIYFVLNRQTKSIITILDEDQLY